MTAPRWIESLPATTYLAESKQLCQVECGVLLTCSTAVLFSKTVSTEPSSLPRDIGQMGATAPQGYATDATKAVTPGEYVHVGYGGLSVVMVRTLLLKTVNNNVRLVLGESGFPVRGSTRIAVDTGAGRVPTTVRAERDLCARHSECGRTHFGGRVDRV